MTDGWPECALNEVEIKVLDCEHRTPPRATDGYPYISIPDIIDGRIDVANARRISAADFRSWTAKTKPQPLDIVVTRRGRVGDSAPIPSSLECAIGQNLVLLRSTGRYVDQRFLRWAAQSPRWWAEVDRLRNVGAVFSSLNVRDISNIHIPVPPIATQRVIVDVLGALDDKIAANAKIVALADSLSTKVFQKMLLDSAPLPLSSAAHFINGKAFTKNATGTGRVVIRIAELNSGIGKSTVYNDLDVDDHFLARPGDLLFAWSGSLTVRRWFREDAIINQHIFKVIPKNGFPLWLVNQLLREKLNDFRAIAADKATTMGHIQRRHLDEPIAAPSQEQIGRYDELMEALWQLALNTEQESLSLAALRDALLPHLMSGRLRVKDAEKHVEAVV